MTESLLLKNVRPMGGHAVDLLVENERIACMEPAITSPDAAIILDGNNQLLMPGLVNAHAHIDKNLLGRSWHKNQVPEPRRIRDYTDNERKLRRELHLSTEVQSEREVRAAIASGVTHIRTHVDIDTDAGLDHFNGVLATREKVGDAITMQLVAFPQSGMLIRPGTVELLEEALRMGAECMGGLDPSVVERDPVRHLDTIFAMAHRHGVELDIHLHEPGMLGAFSVELIAERTRALDMQGHVTISHVFCLGMIEEAYLNQLIDLLLENRITIMSLGSGTSNFPPLRKLHEAGVPLCTGTDGVRDTWAPYNSVNMLERVKLLGYRTGSRRDEEIEMLLNIATYGGATVMGEQDYGLSVGNHADLLVLDAETPAQAVIETLPPTYVIKRGRLVSERGDLRIPSQGMS